jgi:hypothetical protein
MSECRCSYRHDNHRIVSGESLFTNVYNVSGEKVKKSTVSDDSTF